MALFYCRLLISGGNERPGRGIVTDTTTGTRAFRPGRQLRRIRTAVADNGVLWTGYRLTTAALRGLATHLDERMRQLERQRHLTSTNTVRENYATWQNWEWSQQGEEWTVSPEWKQSLIDEVLLRYIEPQRNVLEIGPGAGRWTETLQHISQHLIVVDLSDKCIELCQQRFADARNMEFHVNDGKSLKGIPDASVDFVWSFDVFVHIAPATIDQYLAEVSRELTPGGRGIIHHVKAATPRADGDRGWRSSMTAELFATMLRQHGLTLVTQFDSWGADGQFDVKTFGDTISVFEK